jgi:hypothetical protein
MVLEKDNLPTVFVNFFLFPSVPVQGLDSDLDTAIFVIDLQDAITK